MEELKLLEVKKLINEILEYAVQEYFEGKSLNQLINEIREMRLRIKEISSNGK